MGSTFRLVFPSPSSFFLFEDFEDAGNLLEFSSLSGLSVSEDESYVYIEAAPPGLNPKKVDMTYEKKPLDQRGGRASSS